MRAVIIIYVMLLIKIMFLLIPVITEEMEELARVHSYECLILAREYRKKLPYDTFAVSTLSCRDLSFYI